MSIWNCSKWSLRGGFPLATPFSYLVLFFDSCLLAGDPRKMLAGMSHWGGVFEIGELRRFIRNDFSYTIRVPANKSNDKIKIEFAYVFFVLQNHYKILFLFYEFLHFFKNGLQPKVYFGNHFQRTLGF